MANPVRRFRDFLVELKRRKVYTVAVIYIVAAAGGIQLVNAVVPATRLPDWSDEFFVALVVLGFPLALVLAWAFEMTPEGMRRTSATGVAGPDAGRGAPGPATPATAAPPPGSGGAESRPGPRSSDLDPRAVAVLPFENLSGTEEAAPLAAGLQDDLLTQLSKIAGLTVISRTSVRRYQATDKSMPEIARELNVGTIIEGGVQSARGRVRLNVQVIDARNDVHRWAETYDRELTADNIFDIQSQLAHKIAGTLRAHLTPEQEEAMGRRPTHDLDAYRLHAQGRAQLDRRTEDGLRRALEHFQDAVDRDATYALAWVGLADTLILLHDYGYEDADAVLPKAEDAVRTALALDPDLAEAHASLGLLHAVRREGPEATRELNRAVALRPGYAEAHNWLSWVHLLLGNRREALESAKRSVELNPLSAEGVSHLFWSYLTHGEGEKALAEARRTREIQPDWTTGPFCEALALYHVGRFAEAGSLLRDLSVPWAGSGPRATLALVRAATGDQAAARDLLAEIASADPFAAGLVHAALGESEAAFEAFERADLSGYWPTLAVHHLYPDVWSRLRLDPRHRELLHQIDQAWGMQPEAAG